MPFSMIKAHVEHLFGTSIETRSTPFAEPLPRSMLFLTFATLGALWSVFFFVRFARVVLELYVLPGIPLSRFGAAKTTKSQSSSSKAPHHRTWAVVTGATDGIGREFALQLAQQGFNVFLASRTPEKLAKVAAEIQQASPETETKTHSIDFSAGNEAEYAVLGSKLQSLDVGVLVNNVGMSHSIPVSFAETPEEEMLKIAEINVKATLRVSRMVTAGMVQRNRGLILNIGSFAGQFPVPLLATYAGSKAFLIAFSQAIGEEMRRNNVIVQNVNAYFIVSKLSKIRRPSSMIPTPKQYVKQVLSKIGRSGGAVGRPFNTTPWPAHGLLDWVITSVVAGTHWLLRYNYDNSLVVRKKALKKAAKTQ